MGLSINSSTATSSMQRLPPVQTGREDVKQLAKALKSDDLQAAQAAYADLAKQAPEGATLQPGSAFAKLGKALVTGDMDAAKTAFAELVKSKTGQQPIKAPPPISLPAPVAVQSSTGGSAGSLVNTVA